MDSLLLFSHLHWGLISLPYLSLELKQRFKKLLISLSTESFSEAYLLVCFFSQRLYKIGLAESKRDKEKGEANKRVCQFWLSAWKLPSSIVGLVMLGPGLCKPTFACAVRLCQQIAQRGTQEGPQGWRRLKRFSSCWFPPVSCLLEVLLSMA